MTEDSILLAKRCFDLGLELLDKKKFSEAETQFRRSLDLAPSRPSILVNLVSALIPQGKWAEALSFSRELLTTDPNNFDGHINLGVCLLKTDRQDEAISSFNSAIAINPASPKGWVNKGNALLEKGLLNDAQTCFDTALQLDNCSTEALIGLGNLHNELKVYKLGLNYLSRALEIDPNNYLAQWNKALSLLRLGQFKEGWELYESRWLVNGMSQHIKYQKIPLWLGQETISNKTILVYSEQGYGDAIQMSRFLPILSKERGAKVIFEVPFKLKELMQSLGSGIQIIESGERIKKMDDEKIDFQCPVMSLPLAFKTTLESIPNQTPYLYADPQKRIFWQTELQKISRQTNSPIKSYRIGITWRGSGHYAGTKNSKRDAPFPLIHSIVKFLSSPIIEFHAIQKKWGGDHYDYEDINLYSHDKNLITFADTAALIAELDLVISVDTAVGHLAGALGKDTLLLIPDPPDFMSQTCITKSPWYPNIEFIRQIERGTWKNEQIIATIMKYLPC